MKKTVKCLLLFVTLLSLLGLAREKASAASDHIYLRVNVGSTVDLFNDSYRDQHTVTVVSNKSQAHFTVSEKSFTV